MITFDGVPWETLPKSLPPFLQSSLLFFLMSFLFLSIFSPSWLPSLFRLICYLPVHSPLHRSPFFSSHPPTFRPSIFSTISSLSLFLAPSRRRPNAVLCSVTRETFFWWGRNLIFDKMMPVRRTSISEIAAPRNLAELGARKVGWDYIFYTTH